MPSNNTCRNTHTHTPTQTHIHTHTRADTPQKKKEIKTRKIARDSHIHLVLSHPSTPPKNYPRTTLAPSFPNTPRSFGFGLFPRPFFPLKNPNTPPPPSAFPPPGPSSLFAPLASAGNVASCLARSLQLLPPSRVTCTPPVGDSTIMPGGPPARPEREAEFGFEVGAL